ncbi:MAG: cupin domain-containing protein [Caulobacterales bacterium]
MNARGFVVNELRCELEGWDDPVRGVVQWRTLLSGDRTPTEALTMGVAEVREHAGAHAKLHRHAQSEAYFVLSGRGVLTIDGAEQALSPGDAAFIPGGAWHAARGVGDEPLRLLYVFAADSFSHVEYEFAAPE